MNWRTIVAVLVLAICSSPGLAAGASNPYDANSLAVFKQSTGNAAALNDWVGLDPCGGNWLGVTCSEAVGNSTRRVIQLQLPNSGLSGNIPRILGQLSELQVLDLSSNNLVGVIPNELGNLTRLQTLDLHSNKLVSTLEPWLIQLTDLTTLDLSSNGIWGYIPRAIGMLTKLQTLNLADNNVAGPILPALGGLPNLTMLVLYDNKLNGGIPPELGNLTNLYGLLLHNNSLTGEVPPELAKIRGLGWMFLHDNFLTGLVPPALTVEPQLVARYDGNPLCQNPLNAPYCVVNPKAAPPAPPMAMSPFSASLMNSGLGLNGSCVGKLPCTCSDGRNGTTQCGNEAKDAVCQCKDGGFHWTKTDTIITICVCLGFGMIAKTLCLILYMRRKYLGKGRGKARPLIGGSFSSSPAGSAPIPGIAKPEYNFSPKGVAYDALAGTPSQTSDESFSNGSAKSLLSSKPLHIVIGNGSVENDNGQKWKQGTIADVLKRNAELAAGSEYSSEDGNGDHHHSSSDVGTPASFKERAFRFDGLVNGSVPLLFTFKELQNATQNFSPTLLVGEGGFGRVYYGVLDGREVAVKRLEKTTAVPGKHGEKQFRVEVDMMSRLKHPNLLDFIGYCADKGERALVYPLMVNQSLFRRLHESIPDAGPLDYHRRVTIAYQAARALAYLHDEVSPQVIHRDFNSSNVLLDAKLDAVVSDFGLAKLVSDDSGQTQTTKLFGTMGYMAPEYLHGQVTDKNDVYSFGVVLLELISGRKAVIAKDLDIVQWARGFTKNALGSISMMADPQIADQWPADALQWSVELANACVETEPRRRPRMKDVARGLEVILQAIRERTPSSTTFGHSRTSTEPTSPTTPMTPAETSAGAFPPGFSMTEFLGTLKRA